MAFMISTKSLSIGKPIFPYGVSDRSEIVLGRRCFRRLRMSSEQPKLEVGAEVFLLKGNKVLLGRRRSAIGYGHFALPGGHLEFGERFEECAVREVKEETGLEIRGVEFVTVSSNVILDPKPMQLISVFMRAALVDPNQEPINLEADKCDGWDWYDWNHLPQPLLLTLEALILRDADLTAMNEEPEKCDGWDWYERDHLRKPLFPSL